MAYSDPPPEDFGKRLKRLARERGLSNKALAKETGAHEVTVSRWMGGQVPESPTLLSLARLLGVTPDELMDGAGVAAQSALPDQRAKGRRRATKPKPEEKEG